MPSIAFYTLGCKVNQADTASMERLFRQAGYSIVGFEEKADVYLINTCVVTNMGQSKSRKMINRAIRNNSQAIVVVTGCYPQTAPAEAGAIAGVDLIVGTQERSHIVELVAAVAERGKAGTQSEVRGWLQDCTFEDMPADESTDKTRAFLKIQEGCNQYCTYCIIPYARGPLRSRSIASVHGEVEKLVGAGFKEVVLIGIHLGCYGKEQGGHGTLAEAVNVALAVPDLTRLRLGSLESVEVDNALLELMNKDNRFCRHLHLPLQSGSDGVLKRMHRPYAASEYLKLLEKIRMVAPEIAITTDVIVGFPGETKEEFQETVAFVRKCHFSKIHIFPFSARQGTPAATYPQQVSDAVKKARAAALEEVDKQEHEAFCRSLIGQNAEVLFETQTQQGVWEGLTDTYVRVYVNSAESLSGAFRKVRVTEVFREGVFGELCL